MKTLYISDLDGTLIGADAMPSAFTLKTVNNLSQRGMNISVATSRSLGDAKNILSGFLFNTPVITMNGTFITDISQGENRKTLYHLNLDREKALETAEIIEKCGAFANVFYFENEELTVEYKKPQKELSEYFIRIRKDLYKKFSEVGEYRNGGETVFVAGVGSEREVKAAAREIGENFGFKTTCYRDVYRTDMWFVEVTNANADKATALKKLKEITGAERVVAFGDNLNDLPLFSVADTKIAVANAHPEVLKIADKIIDSNINDGVAKYLLSEAEKYGI